MRSEYFRYTYIDTSIRPCIGEIVEDDNALSATRSVQSQRLTTRLTHLPAFTAIQKPFRMPLDRLLKFPKAPAPNDDPANVKGSLSLDQKQLLVNILAYHIAHHSGSKVFAHDTAGTLKLVEANIKKSGVPTDGHAETAVAETVHEVTVSEGMWPRNYYLYKDKNSACVLGGRNVECSRDTCGSMCGQLLGFVSPSLVPSGQWVV